VGFALLALAQQNRRHDAWANCFKASWWQCVEPETSTNGGIENPLGYLGMACFHATSILGVCYQHPNSIPKGFKTVGKQGQGGSLLFLWVFMWVLFGESALFS
jgi:hypothetical protein